MELYPHQQEALKLTEGENKVAYYLDMGLGKTYVGSDAESFAKSGEPLFFDFGKPDP